MVKMKHNSTKADITAFTAVVHSHYPLLLDSEN